MVRSHFPMPRVALQPQTEALKDKPTYEKHVWILSSSCSFQVSCLLLGYLGMPTWFWKHTFVDRDANPNSMCKSKPKPRHFIVIISLKQIEEVQLLENIKQPLAMQNPITPLPPLPPPHGEYKVAHWTTSSFTHHEESKAYVYAKLSFVLSNPLRFYYQSSMPRSSIKHWHSIKPRELST